MRRPPSAYAEAPCGHDGGSRTGLVEVPELIVETLVHVGLARCWRLVHGVVMLTRPPEGNEANSSGRATSDDNRQQPCQRPEPLVDRRSQHLLAAVALDERRFDLVARFALVDVRRQLGPHLVRRPARILPALGDVRVPAPARADDLVLQLSLELGARI